MLYNFLKRPFAYLFYFGDSFFDNIWLRFTGFFWQFECWLRGGSISTALIYGRPIFKFHPRSKIKIRKNVVMVSISRRCTSSNLYAACRIQTHSESAEIIIEEGVGMNGTSIVCRSSSIIIGKNTMIAPNCIIMDSPFHRIWPPATRNIYVGTDLDRAVNIGANCWIGSNCIILPGVTIGENTVIGAGSIILRDLPPNCLAIGRPAVPVKFFNNQ